MYGASNPARPMASWMVATPKRDNAFTASAGARGIRRTAIPVLFMPGSSVLPYIGGDHPLAAHQQPRGAQQRSARHFNRLVRVHLEHHGELTTRVLHGECLAH